jgi:hypothetical protein
VRGQTIGAETDPCLRIPTPIRAESQTLARNGGVNSSSSSNNNNNNQRDSGAGVSGGGGNDRRHGGGENHELPGVNWGWVWNLEARDAAVEYGEGGEWM